MKENSYKHFTNIDCKFYPCHDTEEINCMFCYCPLYSMENCGGTYSVVDGVKRCDMCTITHEEGGWEHVVERLTEENSNE